MTNEVSCKAYHLFFAPLRKKGVALETILVGTSLSVETLQSKSGRMTWAELCTIHRNLQPHFTHEELVELGRSLFRPRALRFMFMIGRLMTTPLGFYRWINKPRDGGGSQLFACVTPSFREVSENACEIDLLLPDGYEVCWDFFLLTQGSFEQMPTLFGYSNAAVRLERLPNGGRFHVGIPTRAGMFSRWWAAISGPFTSRRAARELKEANETLVERFEELQVARDALDRQRVVLDTAYKLGQRIWGERDPAATAAAIATSLVEIAGYAGASVAIASREAPEAVARASAGVTCDDTAQDVPLSAHLTGSIRVMGEVAESPMLLDLLAPTIGLALDNAFSYRALEEIRANLEKMVDERTVELREARDALAGTVEALKEAQGARQKFFANISHEIRTPLSLIVLAAADVEARVRPLLDERARHSLGSITDGARKLLRLVDELLLLAAGQENKLVMHPEPTDLAALCQQLGSGWRPACEAQGHTLEVRSPAKLIALVDPTALERVASNLVSNAVKYTPKGGRIEVELADEPDGLRLSIYDDGKGISDDLAKRLFGRFERAAEGANKTVGTGIGLSLVKQLVEAHGGTITALPRAKGTEMRVVLPASLKTDAVATTSAPRLARTTLSPTRIVSGQVFTPPELSAGKIVIAEDDPALAERIALLLSDRYTVIVGLDGEAALELVKQHQPQLLITDVDMPKMTGIELAAKFREVTGDRLAPVIILSAVTDLATRVAGLDAGAVDYVGKPFDPKELEARVRAQFRMRELAVRLHHAEQVSMLGILTSGLAHELRNPANGIVNAIEPLVMMLPPNLPKGVGELFEVVKECAQQVGFLSQQLLGFRGNAALQLQPAHIPELVQRAAALAQAALTGIDLRTKITLDHGVMCAPPLLVQVLTNLIENAGHAAGKGGWVDVRAATELGHIVVEVTDSGPGVPIPLRERIFEPFFTTKPQGIGTGLGLSLARAIVQRHGGVLEVRERGQRSAFVIELPDSAAAPRSNAVSW